MTGGPIHSNDTSDCMDARSFALTDFAIISVVGIVSGIILTLCFRKMRRGGNRDHPTHLIYHPPTPPKDRSLKNIIPTKVAPMKIFKNFTGCMRDF